MSKPQLFIIGFVYIFFIYLSSITSYIIEKFSSTDDKTQLLGKPLDLFMYPATNPISNVINLVKNQSTIFFVLMGIATLFIIYVILKTLFGSSDGNLKNQDYKIAKHGSHGSARFATLKEIFNSGHYKSINKKSVNTLVLQTLDESLLNENQDKE